MNCRKNQSILEKVKNYFSNKEVMARGKRKENKLKKIILVGSPNVGKSVLFNILTGAYVTVSNYPGTTVEISEGKGKIFGRSIEVIDTPGMYSLLPITEEEKVAREILLSEIPDVVLHVIDAKNLKRMLSLTLQLIEAGLPLILVVNIMDEARKMGMEIDTQILEEELGIPVVATSAAFGEGIGVLKEKIAEYIFSRNIDADKKVG
mgnify:CR=1 FL=1